MTRSRREVKAFGKIFPSFSCSAAAGARMSQPSGDDSPGSVTLLPAPGYFRGQA